MAIKLTARQAQILDLIRQAITRTGRPPTRAEIAQQLGFRSANAAEDHLRALQRKGHVRLAANTSRGIELIESAALSGANGSMRRTARTGGLPGRSPHAAESALDPALYPTPDNIHAVPLIGRVAAGHPILAAEHVERTVALAPQLFDMTPDYLLRVRGSSMRDAGILDGDLLAVHSTPEARHGQIVIARLGDDVTVKRLEHHGKRIRLLPENPDFDPIEIGAGDDFAIEGIAVGLIRTTALH